MKTVPTDLASAQHFSKEQMVSDWEKSFSGALLGMAVGDALGLPREGMSARRAQRMFGVAPLRHCFLVGWGMCSDDTEHACMTAQALLASGGDPVLFGRSLAWRLRGWLLGVPAGIGLGTLRAILKLWMGFGPKRSGVHSAGNGPAMRATVLGVWMAAMRMNAERRNELVRICTELTHRDERAVEGAWVIAATAAWVAEGGGDAQCLIERLLADVKGDELRRNLGRVKDCLASGAGTAEFVASLGLSQGVTGYINHTVPVALFCFLRWPSDFRQAVSEAILAGGDTDTVGGIVGSLAGAAHGPAAIPAEWRERLWEWPRSTEWVRRVGGKLAARATGESGEPVPLFWPGLIIRNLFFIVIVLAHGMRRLLPPY